MVSFYDNSKKSSGDKRQLSADTGSLKDMTECDQEVEILDPGKEFTSVKSPKALISKQSSKRIKKQDEAVEQKEKLAL